jgi:polyphosphate kinase
VPVPLPRRLFRCLPPLTSMLLSFPNRELTWLEFNRRVLHMAADEQTPLLERVKFLAIVSGNLDEFFMKRIGGLKQQIAAGINTPTVDGRTPMEQMRLSQVMVRELQREQNQIFYQLLELLDAKGIRLIKYMELSNKEREELREQFINNIFPPADAARHGSVIPFRSSRTWP